MIEIREGKLTDAEAISNLVIACTRHHIGPTLSAYGLERLVDAMSTGQQKERLVGDYKFFVAFKNKECIGVSSIKRPDHLYYLFVSTEHQKFGYGRALFQFVFEFVVNETESESITVNSSLNSVPFYSRLGFVEAGPVKNDDEIVFQPMLLKLERSNDR